jgi:hypothetical protein
MAAPLAGIAIRYVAQRAAGFAVKTIARQYGKRTSRQRMVQVARKVGGKPMAPAPQGPYYAGFERMQSTRGEHRISSGTPKARKTMRGGSAPVKSYRLPYDTSGHKVGTRGPCDPGFVYRIVKGRPMCVRR